MDAPGRTGRENRPAAAHLLERSEMLGAMQDWDLRVTHLIDHAAREHGSREIVTRWADGSETRTNWAGIRHDALRMTQALR